MIVKLRVASLPRRYSSYAGCSPWSAADDGMLAGVEDHVQGPDYFLLCASGVTKRRAGTSGRLRLSDLALYLEDIGERCVEWLLPLGDWCGNVGDLHQLGLDADFALRSARRRFPSLVPPHFAHQEIPDAQLTSDCSGLLVVRRY